MMHATFALPRGGPRQPEPARSYPQRRALRNVLCCAVGLAVLCHLRASPADGTASVAASGAEAPLRPPAPARHLANRRQLLASSVAATATAAADPAHAITVTTGKTEIVRAPVNPKAGTRSYLFEKPAGFKRFASPVDPSGFVFRNVNDTYLTFVTRAELRANASTDFTPQDFINEYKGKFSNSTGSSFELIKGGGAPDRVDSELGVKYYEVEYIVRTQLGFSFDSLRSLHFFTIFAAAPDSVYILNAQALDDNWATDGPVLKKVVDSFAVTS